MSEKDSIPGHQRVAAFLLSLDAEAATTILRHMKEDIVSAVAQAMVDLDPRLTEVGTIDGLYRELAGRINGPKKVRACATDELGQLLTTSFGRQRGEEVFQGILERRRIDRPFIQVEAHQPAHIALALSEESPAITALVLGYLEPALSAKILELGDDETATDVVRRIATLSAPPPAVLLAIAAKLAERLAEIVAAPEVPNPTERLRSIAEILNSSTPTIEKGVMEAISTDDAEMAAELREYLFTWDDIGSIDKRAMQKILGTVDTKTLSIALKACSAEVEANVMGNLSERVGEMVGEERELAGAVAMSEVESARASILQNIRAMIEAGEFAPSRGGSDLVT